MNASISVVCYKSKTLSNGESPLMLQITKDKKRKYQSLGISVNPKHWNFLKGEPKPKCPNRDYILKIILAKKEELQRKVLEFNSRQREYSVYSLLKETERTQHMTVGEFYLALIDEFERNGKLGNSAAARYQWNRGGAFQPYVSAKLGAEYAKIRSNFSMLEARENSWGFYASPEVGINVFPWVYGPGLHFALYYSYGTNKADVLHYSVDGLSNFGFRLGVSF